MASSRIEGLTQSVGVVRAELGGCGCSTNPWLGSGVEFTPHTLVLGWGLHPHHGRNKYLRSHGKTVT